VIFSQKALNFDRHNSNRVRRFLRTYYGAFDRVFVLNSEQRKWFTGHEMNFEENRVCQTAHWVDAMFKPEKSSKKETLGIDNDRHLMLYIGRLSKEKGVLELPSIYRKVKESLPDVALLVVGHGPACEQLKEEAPEIYYIDWAPNKHLSAIYSAADILVFPSKFDAFSRVVLESLSCGLPVIAYNCEGINDIINDGECGYLVETQEQICEKIIAYLNNPQMQKEFRKAAVKRAQNYNVDDILEQFVADMGL
jgi:glycosyltransferase involved in cell wall biosynthesis